MKYRILMSDDFKKHLNKIDSQLQQKIFKEMALIQENPLRVVEKLEQYAAEDELPVNFVKKGESGGYAVWTDNYVPANFFIRRQIACQDQYRPFDIELESGEKAMFFGDSKTEFCHSLAKFYLMHEAGL